MPDLLRKTKMPGQAVSVRLKSTPDVPRCVYCGDVAGTRDHLAPSSLLSPGIKSKTVPACRDCNCVILGAYPYGTEVDRGLRVLDVLTRRLKRTPVPKWADEEIRELRGRIRHSVVTHLNNYVRLLSRVEFAQAVYAPEQEE